MKLYFTCLLLGWIALIVCSAILWLSYPSVALPISLAALFTFAGVSYVAQNKWGEYRPKPYQPSRLAVAAVRTGITMFVIGFGWEIFAILSPAFLSLTPVIVQYLMIGIPFVGVAFILAGHYLFDSYSIPIFSLIAYSLSKKHRQTEEEL
ncbi:MAG: hypothetical protein ACLQEQ_00955 [Nitrososphaerales archaeon]